MYLSYLVKSKDEEVTIREWHTVKVSDCGKFVINKNGVKWGIAPFLKREHHYHETENPPFNN